MQEARRNLAEFLNFTDLEIVNASGEVNEALLNHVDSIPAYGVLRDLKEQGLTPQDIFRTYALAIRLKLPTSSWSVKPTVKQASPTKTAHGTI